MLGSLANCGNVAVLLGSMSVLSVFCAVFLLLAMALLMGPLSNVATASSTGPKSTWIPDGGGCGGSRAEDMPPTTAPSSPPAIAS